MPGTAGAGRGPGAVVEGVVDSVERGRTVGWGAVEVTAAVVVVTILGWGGDEVGSWEADVTEGMAEGTAGWGVKVEEVGTAVWGAEVEETIGSKVAGEPMDWGADATERTGAEVAGGTVGCGTDVAERTGAEVAGGTKGWGSEVAGGSVGKGAEVTAGSPGGCVTAEAMGWGVEVEGLGVEVEAAECGGPFSEPSVADFTLPVADLPTSASSLVQAGLPSAPTAPLPLPTESTSGEPLTWMPSSSSVPTAGPSFPLGLETAAGGPGCTPLSASVATTGLATAETTGCTEEAEVVVTVTVLGRLRPPIPPVGLEDGVVVAIVAPDIPNTGFGTAVMATVVVVSGPFFPAPNVKVPGVNTKGFPPTDALAVANAKGEAEGFVAAGGWTDIELDRALGWNREREGTGVVPKAGVATLGLGGPKLKRLGRLPLKMGCD